MWLWTGGLQSGISRLGAEHQVSWKLRLSPGWHLTLDLTGGPATSPHSRQLPHAPEHPVATLSTAERRAINLTWGKPFDGNSPLSRYILEVSENSKAPRQPRPTTAARAAGTAGSTDSAPGLASRSPTS